MLHVVRKVVIKKSKKPFTLDKAVDNLKDGTTQIAKQYNWEILATELKKFAIVLTKQ